MIRRATTSSWGNALAAVALSRLLWLGVFVAVLAIDFPSTPLLSGLRAHLVSWDAISYLSIAVHGYPAHLDYRDAFLPGFPLLVRVLAIVTRDDVTAAWLVNAVAETIALWYLGRLVLGERDRSSAGFSVWLLALAPTALFLIAPFSESSLHRVGRGEPLLRSRRSAGQGGGRRSACVRVPAHRARADSGARHRATAEKRMAAPPETACGHARSSPACDLRSVHADPYR